jgi:hypothetical protein
LLTRSAISPSPHTDVRLALVVDVVMIVAPEPQSPSNKGIPWRAGPVQFYLAHSPKVVRA